MNAAPTQVLDVAAAPVSGTIQTTPPVLDAATTSEISVKVVDSVLAGGTGSTIAVLFAFVIVSVVALAWLFRRSDQQVTARLDAAQRDNDELQKKMAAMEARHEAERRECAATAQLRQQEALRLAERERERADVATAAAQVEVKAMAERHAAEISMLRDKAEAEKAALSQEFRTTVANMQQVTTSEYRLIIQNVTHSIESMRQVILSARDVMARSSDFGFSSGMIGAPPQAPDHNIGTHQRSDEA